MEITGCFKYEPTFNGSFSRKNVPTIKHGAYVINLNDKKKVKEHIRFYYSLIEIKLYSLILLELNISLLKN